MRRTDHSAPFDAASPTGWGDHADLTEEFWGDAPTWRPREHTGETPRPRLADRQRSRSSDDTTGAIRAIRDGIDAFRPQRVHQRDSSGAVQRTRVHGVVKPATGHTPTEPDREVTLGELAAGWYDEPIPVHPPASRPAQATPSRPQGRREPVEDATLVPLTSISDRLGLGAVDPLLVRLGALVLIGALLVPLALALRPSPDGGRVQTANVPPVEVITVDAQPAAAPGATLAPIDGTSGTQASDVSDVSSADATASVAAEPATNEAPAQPTSAAASGSGSDSTNTALDDPSAPTGAVTLSENPSTGQAATVDAAAERVVPDCSQQYIAGPGDSWYRIAEAAGTAPGDLLNENRATLDTVIFPGDEICLPKGATVPSTPPATTAAPTTTEAPSTTQAPTTTEAPSTTAAPTTTDAPSNSTPVIVSTDEVQRLIREIWPADQHEKALQVAWRESRYRADADNNFCCYGVFQIYFTVHRSWLDDFGIYTATDLFDARKNITAAYELYQRAGGWGPWGG